MREEGGSEVVVRYARRGLTSCPSCLLSSFLGSEYTRPLVLCSVLGSGYCRLSLFLCLEFWAPGQELCAVVCRFVFSCV